MKFRVLISCLVLTSAQILEAQTFGDVTGDHNINATHPGGVFGNGVSFADFNGDGWDDLSFLQYNESPLFYENIEGQFQYTNLDIELYGDPKMILWADYDSDGDQDLLITRLDEPVLLYNNDGDMNFTEVAESAGIAPQWVGHYGASWGDYNRDGFLDLYLCKYHNPDFDNDYEHYNHLYQNNGDGTFSDVTFEAGVGDDIRASFQSVFIDLNRDGWEDLFIINDKYSDPNSLYINNGDGTFTDVSASSGMNLSFDAMCANAGDYDLDGDFDFYLTNSPPGNFFMVNNGDQTFVDQAADLGIAVYEESWGSIWMDYQCDGREDLYVATVGYGVDLELANHFFRNYLDDSFVAIENSVGLGQDIQATLAVAMGDFDNDGYPDFVQNNVSPSSCRLYQNSGGDNHWMKIGLEGTVSHPDGYGNLIDLYVNGSQHARYTHCGESYLAQFGRNEMFGLGNEEAIDSVTISWNSGWQETFYDLVADSSYQLKEGQTLPNLLDLDEIVICPGDIAIVTIEESWDSVLWSTGETGFTTNLSLPGLITVIGYVSGLPLATDSVQVSFFPEPEISIESVPVACYGDNTGSALINADSITMLEWDNGSTELMQDSLAAGIYTFTYASDEGCVYVDSILVEQNPAIEYATSLTHVSCFGESDGSFSVLASGGAGIAEIIADSLFLQAGEYEVLIIDSADCTLDFVVSVEQPDEIILNLAYDPPTNGNNGTAEIEVEGGTPPYSINWSTGEQDVNSIDQLAEGDFSVEVVDSNGCTLEESFVLTHVLLLTHQFNIYPNPVISELFINLPESSGLFDAEIRDLSGALISNYARISNQIDVNQLSPGIYFLRLYSDNLDIRYRFVKGDLH